MIEYPAMALDPLAIDRIDAKVWAVIAKVVIC